MNEHPSDIEFEIHFAAELGAIPNELRSALYSMGFRDDGLVGQGVVFSPDDPLGKVSCPLVGMHVSWETFQRDAYVAQKAAFERIVQSHSDCCVGYAHAEVVRPEWDVDLTYKPFDASVPYPVLPFKASIGGRSKEWDIHISAHAKHLDARLSEVLFDYGHMYYIDVLKPSGVFRVFTIQGTNSVHEGRELFCVLRTYLSKAGGMLGAIKYEETCFWATYGSPQIVPPVIDQVRYVNH